MTHTTHLDHSHAHGDKCGHTKIQHEGHVDYVHDGHLHHSHEGHVDEHALAVTATQPAACDASHPGGGHSAEHHHAKGCGHEQVPHGDHVDYLVGSHLHSAHGNHCDDHGAVALS
jgi:hypothetical protein